MTTRPASSLDTDFLLQVFFHSEDSRARLTEIDPRLIQLQFLAQQRAYAARFPAATHDIIVVGGDRAGQVRWADLPGEIRIIDIGLLPPYRRLGAATAVYARILAHAEAVRKPARATVATLNAASLAFHQRLGFAIEGQSETDCVLAYSART